LNWDKNQNSDVNADLTASINDSNGCNVERSFNLIHKTWFTRTSADVRCNDS